MFKKIYCELRIPVVITPVDALLIKSGTATVSGPDSSFVKTYRNGKETPFLPGSSLKGIMRSQAEKIVRTITERTNSCCLPYERKGTEKFCGEYFQKYEKDTNTKLSGATLYSKSCPICKMFGSTSVKGHFSVSDAYTNDNVPMEPRDGVAIDRLTGGAAGGAKFDLEVINKGNFEAEIHLRNFESWQLGLLGFLIKDINDGILRLGSGTSRGLGRIKLEIKEFQLIYYRSNLSELMDVGEMATNDEISSYGFFTSTDAPKVTVSNNGSYRTLLNLSAEDQEKVFDWGAKNLNSFLKNNDWYNNIQNLGN